MVKRQHSMHTDIRDSVLRNIRDRGMEPIPKAAFIIRECALWVVFVFSVGVGAVAVSILTYAHSYMRYEPFAAVTGSYVAYVLALVPLLWVVVLIGMVFVAYINMRATKRGYRHSLIVLVGGSILLSTLLGGLLHRIGISHAIEQVFDRTMPMYPSHEDREIALWLASENGRLVGKLQGVPTSTHEILIFVDADKNEWSLATHELAMRDQELLRSGDRVRLIGVASTTESHFHACGVFPWLYDIDMPHSEREEELRDFMLRVYSHLDEEGDGAQSRAEAIEKFVLLREDTSSFLPMGICKEAAVTKRLEKHMQKEMQ